MKMVLIGTIVASAVERACPDMSRAVRQMMMC